MEVKDSDTEYAHQMVIVDERIQESSNAESLAGKNQKKSSLKMRTLSKIPPGGLLDIKGVHDENIRIPAMEGLRIEQYSNAMFWQFAPHLEPVCCGPKSLICRTDVAYPS